MGIHISLRKLRIIIWIPWILEGGRRELQYYWSSLQPCYFFFGAFPSKLYADLFEWHIKQQHVLQMGSVDDHC